ncbi:MAG: BlaI/MecI/CopY family transcriptional regulator [Lachnospiraceae bacterium]|nr:BlaI/MecI/CopY family transcriptional regulator [Lachnospiraceae bacterium]
MKEQEEIRLSDGEYRLMDIVWDREPVSAAELAGICLEKFGWKKSTVYTVLKRLGDKGILSFENKIVASLVKMEQVDRTESEALLEKAYGGSVANFFAAFLQDRKLTAEEAERIRKMIREASE